MTLMDKRNEAMQAVINQYKPEGYRNPEEVSDAEALGCVVAHWAKWDGAKIMEAFLSALEDANFHTLRKQIEELWEKQA